MPNNRAKIRQNENVKLISVIGKLKRPAIKERTANAVVFNITKQSLKIKDLTQFIFKTSNEHLSVLISFETSKQIPELSDHNNIATI